MWNILIVLIILSSIIVIPDVADNFWRPKESVFLIIGFIMLACNFIFKQEKNLVYRNKWIGLIFIYTILSFGWYFYRPLIFAKEGEKVFWQVWNYIQSLNIILAFFMLKDLVEYTDNLHRWLKIANVLCWVGFSFSIYAILQYFGIDQIFPKSLNWNNPNHMVTFMGNSMHSANFIAMLSPLCLIFKDIRYKIFYVITFIALILINSTISMIGFLTGLFFYLLLTKKFRLAIGLFLLCVVSIGIIYFVYPQYLCFSGRFDLWKITLKGWFKRPFTGWGLGSFAILNYRDSTTSLALAAENDFLQILHDGGLFLFVFVMGYLCNLFKRIIISKETMLLIGYTCAFMSYLVIGMGSFIISIAPLALVGIIYIAALEVQV